MLYKYQKRRKRVRTENSSMLLKLSILTKEGKRKEYSYFKKVYFNRRLILCAACIPSAHSKIQAHRKIKAHSEKKTATGTFYVRLRMPIEEEGCEGKTAVCF